MNAYLACLLVAVNAYSFQLVTQVAFGVRLLSECLPKNHWMILHDTKLFGWCPSIQPSFHQVIGYAYLTAYQRMTLFSFYPKTKMAQPAQLLCECCLKLQQKRHYFSLSDQNSKLPISTQAHLLANCTKPRSFLHLSPISHSLFSSKENASCLRKSP